MHLTYSLSLDLSNYTIKLDLKNGIGVDTSKFAKNVDLVNLKSDVDKLEYVPSNSNALKGKVDKSDVDELVADPVDLRKAKWFSKK